MVTDTRHIGEEERQRLLRAFDELIPKLPERDAEEVEAELAEVRRARRAGGRRSSSERRR